MLVEVATIKFFVILAGIFCLALAVKLRLPEGIHLSDEMILEINSLNTSWKVRADKVECDAFTMTFQAGRNFQKAELPYLMTLLGVKEQGEQKPLTKEIEVPSDLPESFDARKR